MESACSLSLKRGSHLMGKRWLLKLLLLCGTNDAAIPLFFFFFFFFFYIFYWFSFFELILLFTTFVDRWVKVYSPSSTSRCLLYSDDLVRGCSSFIPCEYFINNWLHQIGWGVICLSFYSVFCSLPLGYKNMIIFSYWEFNFIINLIKASF